MSNKLYKLIEGKAWIEAIQRCQTHPDDAKYIHEKGDHTTPLHMAVLKYSTKSTQTDLDKTIQLMRQLIQLHPTAVICKSKSIQNTPLHWACDRKCSTEILMMLLAATPTPAISWQNCYGFTPLHYACAFDDSDDFEQIGLILERLIQHRRDVMFLLSQMHANAAGNPLLPVDCVANIVSYSPIATAVPDCDGNTPLFIMLRKQNLTGEIIRLMVRSVPAQVMLLRNGGELDTPLHIALTNESIFADIDTIRFLIDAQPAALLVQNDYEWSPIHVAVMSYAPIEILTLLVSTEPSSLLLQDYKGKTALMRLMESSYPMFFQAVQLFVSSYPDSLLVRDSSGSLPIDIAIEEEVPDDIMEILQNVQSDAF